MTPHRDHGSLDEHVRFAGELARWIRRAGVPDGDAIGDLAVGMADILHAARSAEEELDELLKLDPAVPENAEKVLELLTSLNVTFVHEVLPHAQDLKSRWDELEAPIVAHLPDDEDESVRTEAG